MSASYRRSDAERRSGPSRLSIDCPHCSAPSRVRTSRGLTPLVRTAHLQCTNLDCGHTFSAQIEITHTISPSRLPNPAIILPVAPPRQRAVPANDNGGREVPPTTPLMSAPAIAAG